MRKFYVSALIFKALVLGAQQKDSTLINLKNIKIHKEKPGIKFESLDKNYSLKMSLRAQFRISFPYDEEPTKTHHFETGKTNFNVRRARLKMIGNAYKPWLKYKMEYDLEGSNLLDLYFKVEKLPYLSLKVGRWKADYSRERIISSASQQALDRSIINLPFTIDRQNGISLYGNIKGKGSANFNYWLAAFMGTGRNETSNDDTHLMYMFKTQWNINGRTLKMTGSDLKYHDKFTSLIAIAGVTNKSPYTRFSGSGGEQLKGFEDGVAGQYRLNQYLIETAFKYKGWSWQQEYHWKEINDDINQIVTHLTGNYVQLGYFPTYSLNFVPKNLELFGRHSFYNPDLDFSNNTRYEYTFGANWFFNGHNNKLTLEYSHFDYNQFDFYIGEIGNRIRFQWDISF